MGTTPSASTGSTTCSSTSSASTSTSRASAVGGACRASTRRLNSRAKAWTSPTSSRNAARRIKERHKEHKEHKEKRKRQNTLELSDKGPGAVELKVQFSSARHKAVECKFTCHF